MEKCRAAADVLLSLLQERLNDFDACDYNDIAAVQHFGYCINELLRSSNQYIDVQPLINAMRHDYSDDEYGVYGKEVRQYIVQLQNSPSSFITQSVNVKSQGAYYNGCLPCHPLEDWKQESETFFGNSNLQYMFACEELVQNVNDFMTKMGKDPALWEKRKVFDSEDDVMRAANYFGCPVCVLVHMADAFKSPYPTLKKSPILRGCTYYQLITATEIFLRNMRLDLFLQKAQRKEWEWKNRHEQGYYFYTTEEQVEAAGRALGTKHLWVAALRVYDKELWKTVEQPVLWQGLHGEKGTNEIYTKCFETKENIEQMVAAVGKTMDDWWDRWRIDRPFFETTEQLKTAASCYTDEIDYFLTAVL